MRRFSLEDRNTIIKLREEGKSLYQICNILNRGKSTVYYQIRKNFGKSYKTVELDLSNQNLVGEIIGLFASDGSCVPQSSYQVRFHLDINEEAYAHNFCLVLNAVFNKMPAIFKTKRNCLVISYKSKIIYELIRDYLSWDGKKSYSISLKTLDYPNEFLIGFLRGYFDGDGYSRDDQRLAQFVTTSKDMFNQLQKILSSFNLSFFPREYNDRRENRHTTYYISLRRLEAVKFINLVEPRNSKRLKTWVRSIAWSSKLEA